MNPIDRRRLVAAGVASSCLGLALGAAMDGGSWRTTSAAHRQTQATVTQPTPETATVTPTDTFTSTSTATFTPTSTFTSTATVQATASATPTITASSTVEASSTVTPPPPTVTPDGMPGRVHLPIVVNVACRPELTKADVALLIDASSSMRELDGRVTKIDAAKLAAHEFIDLLQLGRDRAAVIEFHAVPHLLVPITADRDALHEAVDAISTAEGTQMDAAIEAAAEELRIGSRRGSTRVVLLMTDGRPAPGATEATLHQATLLKASGAVLYTVGLGADVDADLLRAMASRPDTYLQAPTAAQLGAAIREIGAQLPCPGGGVWPALSVPR